MKYRILCLATAAALVLLSGCSGGTKQEITYENLNSSDIKLSVTQGTAADFAVSEKFPDTKIQYYSTIPDGCAAVKAGKTDGYSFDKVVLEYYAKKNPETVVMDESIGTVDICAAVAKDNTGLCDKVNAFITQLRADGTLKEMEERWLNSENPQMPELEKPQNPAGTLRIVTEALTEPFTYYADGGSITGFDIEFGTRLAYAMNMDVSVESMAFEALVPALQTGKADIILNDLNETPERDENALFTEPYFTADIGILVRADRYTPAISKLNLSKAEIDSRLENATVGAMTGTRGSTYIEDNYPDAQLMQFDSMGDAVAALQSGKVDYAICGVTKSLNYAKANNDIAYIDYPLTEEGLAIAVKKGNTKLQDKINKCIEEYRKNGVLDDMKKRWIDETSNVYETADIPVHSDGEVLCVAVAANAEPLCFVYNNKISGHDCELIERIAYDLGMRVEYQDMSFSAEIASVQSGKADVALSVVPTEERKKSVDFTEVYFNNPQTLITRKANNENMSFSEKVTAFFEDIKESFIGTFITEHRWKLILNGLGVTIALSVAAFIFATLWGAVLCMMGKSKKRLINGFARVYMRIVQGTPLLVILMLLYFVVFKGVDIPALAVAIIGFGLYDGAGLAGIFKTGIDSVDIGQIEAAEAIGFQKFDIFKKIVFPQAANHVFGLYKGAFVSLTKATSIVGYIAIQDLTKVSDIIRSRTYDAFFPIITTAVIYFIVTYILITLISAAQRRLDPKKRKRTLKGVEAR